MSATPPSHGIRISLIIGGILFAGLWIAAHFVWASMALMGTLMANDAGAATSDQHVAFMGGMLGGQILAGAAGIPGGLAFFWRSLRKWLWILFAALFVGGAVWQVVAFQSFTTAASSPP
jgi:hypothetical protein